MPKHIWRDLYIDEEKRILFRQNMNESKHFMWQFGGVPMINANYYNQYKDKIDHIGFKTDKGKYVVKKDLFEEYKQVYHNGDEDQYYVDKFYLCKI